MNICIVGATGNVGRKILEVIEQKNFSYDELHLVASPKSAGKKILYKKKISFKIHPNYFELFKTKKT